MLSQLLPHCLHIPLEPFVHSATGIIGHREQLEITQPIRQGAPEVINLGAAQRDDDELRVVRHEALGRLPAEEFEVEPGVRETR